MDGKPFDQKRTSRYKYTIRRETAQIDRAKHAFDSDVIFELKIRCLFSDFTVVNENVNKAYITCRDNGTAKECER